MQDLTKGVKVLVEHLFLIHIWLKPESLAPQQKGIPLFHKAYRIVHYTWSLKCLYVLFFLSFPTCLSSNSVKTTIPFLLLHACMMWNMIGMKSPCWNPAEFFTDFKCTSCLQFFSYSPNIQEICFTCLRISWMDIFTCYLGSKVPELYHGCNSWFNRYTSVCQIYFLSGIYEFFHSSIGW